MPPSSISSPRPTGVAVYQTSSPRHSSPLNPSPKSFSPPLPSGHIPRISPVGEMSDTLPPLREYPEPGLASSPPRSRTPSLSRSSERSSTMCAIPHRAYARHPSPSNSPYAQCISFPASSRSSTPLPCPSQLPRPQSPLPLSPSCNSPRQGSPASFHSFHTSPLRSPQSHLNLTQSSPIQIIPSPTSRYPRTQSLIQQSFSSPYATQAASSPACGPRSRRVSLGAESRPLPSIEGNPVPVGHPFVQATSALAKGDATPLNEAPIRWWGGRRSWDDDWVNFAHGHEMCDPCATHFTGPKEFDGTAGVAFGPPEYGSPLEFREPFGFGGGPGAFLDDEIRASFDGNGSAGISRLADPTTPGLVHTQGPNVYCAMEGIPPSRGVPMPVPPRGTRSEIHHDNFGHCEAGAGLPSIDSLSTVQRMSDNLVRRHSCHIHLRSNQGCMPNGAMTMYGQEPGQNALGFERHSLHSRRFSDISTHSSTSFASCTSGPSESQSQLLLMSASQSHTSTCPSLSSLGIGIEEAEREELRSRTFWRRRSGSIMKRESKETRHGVGGHNEDICHGYPSGEKCGLEHTDSLKGERVGKIQTGIPQRQDTDLKSAALAHDKDVVKHGSLLVRVGLKHVSAYDEQMRQEGYNRAERCVSLAVTSILSPATVATLSPVGETLVRARESVRYIGQEIGPVVREVLSMSTEALKFAPCAGLEEAAKVLLSVWDACQKVDTNRLSCLRLAERCANLLYSVRCELEETDEQTVQALVEPVQRLCGALVQIRAFLETQLRRPFLKRYVRREEITRELQACNDAITDAVSKFGISIQIRTYHQVCTAVVESKRVAQETQALLSMDYQIIQMHYAMMYGQQVQALPGVGTPTANIQGLVSPASASGSTNARLSCAEEGNGGRGHLNPSLVSEPSSELIPPTTVGPLSMMDKAMSTGSGSGRNTPMSSMFSTGQLPDASEATVSAPPTPAQTQTIMTPMKTLTPTYPMNVLKEVHRAQDSVDFAADEAALRGTLEGALSAQNDVTMVRCLQVARGEIPEAAETLRRMLDAGAEAGVNENEHIAAEGKCDVNKETTKLDEKFMRSGIEAMTRLTSVDTKQPRGGDNHLEPGEGASTLEPQELPSWTITRYEVVRRRKIGVGFFADVYLGHWRDRAVVIKVLAHTISREAFVRHVELSTALDHPNVLSLYGASSAVGEKPWFFVNELCSGGNLVEVLQGAKERGTIKLGDLTTVCVDLLRFMHEIALGMAYLHGCGVLHGDLRAANVLVNGNGRCMLSDFGQCEIKAEAHRSCGQLEPHLIRWRAPEMLASDDPPTSATDVYAFAICCIEILGMGDLPWGSLDDKAIYELVLDKDERPPIPRLAEYAEVTLAVLNLVNSSWVREPNRRPSFSSIATSLEDAWRLQGHVHPQICRTSTPSNTNKPVPVTPTESSPGDEQYETASESMMTEAEEESADGMMDVPLTSPTPGPGNGDLTCSIAHVNMSRHTGPDAMHLPSDTFGYPSQDVLTLSPTTRLDTDRRNEEIYRLIVGTNHAFPSSLTLPLWSPTHVELGAVGYLSKPSGEFITLFNAIDPLQSVEEPLRRLPSMYGYGKFEVQKREDGKRSVAQRGLDAISGFLTFKTRGDRLHPERIARQYAFPLAQGEPSAHLYVEKTVHQYMNHLEAPTTWFEQHVNLILEVLGPRHGVQREDLILVIETLDAPDWAMFVSKDHADGRAQFNVFAGREKGEPWGMFTIEGAVQVKAGSAGSTRWVDVGQGSFTSKVSCVPPGGGHDVVSDTVLLAGLRFERGIQLPMVM